MALARMTQCCLPVREAPHLSVSEPGPGSFRTVERKGSPKAGVRKRRAVLLSLTPPNQAFSSLQMKGGKAKAGFLMQVCFLP